MAAVLIAPDADADRGVVEQLCATSATATGLDVAMHWCESEDELVATARALRLDGVPLVVSCEAVLISDDLYRAATLGDAPLVWLCIREDSGFRSVPWPSRRSGDVAGRVIAGRGLGGYRWALSHLAAETEWPSRLVRYGDAPDQVGDLRVPSVSGQRPVCVLLHGGSWRHRWERDLMDGLSVDLARRGFATLNLEYRRVGPSGGGWPETAEDVAAGVDALAALGQEFPLDLSRVTLVGHSAGAQLAAVEVARHRARRGEKASLPLVTPSSVVLLAGVLDLVESGRREVDESATPGFLGARPFEDEERYRAASPLELLPLGLFQLVVCGLLDSPDLVDMSRRYVTRAARLGDAVEYLELDQAGHFDVIEPRGTAWAQIVSRMGDTTTEALGGQSPQP